MAKKKIQFSEHEILDRYFILKDWEKDFKIRLDEHNKVVLFLRNAPKNSENYEISELCYNNGLSIDEELKRLDHERDIVYFFVNLLQVNMKNPKTLGISTTNIKYPKKEAL